MLQALTPLFALCAAMIVRTDRRIVRLLERAGATIACISIPRGGARFTRGAGVGD